MKLLWRNVAVIEITRWDWPHNQMVCNRLQPILRPHLFRRRIRAIVGCHNDNPSFERILRELILHFGGGK